MTAAPVNRILPASFVDGPGNRCVVFLQGCNFHCLYCHNPETIGLCTSCGDCVSCCPTGALTLLGGKVRWRQDLCCGCGLCFKHCPHSATPRTRWMEASEVMEELAPSLPFVRGLTVSGGECSLHRDFLCRLFGAARQAGLSTLMDSNGGLPIAQDPGLMAVCDGVMLDIKAVDRDFHRQLTGQDNKSVLDNAQALASLGKLAEIRTVMLAGCRHNAQTVQGAAQLLGPYVKDIPYRLIRFRPLGVRGTATSWQSPANDEMDALYQLALHMGFKSVHVV